METCLEKLMLEKMFMVSEKIHKKLHPDQKHKKLTVVRFFRGLLYSKINHAQLPVPTCRQPLSARGNEESDHSPKFPLLLHSPAINLRSRWQGNTNITAPPPSFSSPSLSVDCCRHFLGCGQLVFRPRKQLYCSPKTQPKR